MDAANALALSIERLATAYSSALGASVMARESFRAMSAQPKIPNLIETKASAAIFGDRWKVVETRE